MNDLLTRNQGDFTATNDNLVEVVKRQLIKTHIDQRGVRKFYRLKPIESGLSVLKTKGSDAESHQAEAAKAGREARSRPKRP
jgi:hypothetical protein